MDSYDLIVDPPKAIAFVRILLEFWTISSHCSFVILFDGHLTRKQVRRNICNLLKIGYLELEGSKNTTQYMIGEKFKSEKETMLEALEIGFKEIQSRNNQVDEEE